MHKGVQSSNQPQNNFVTDLDVYHDSSQPVKNIRNYNQCALIQKPRNKSCNHHVIYWHKQTCLLDYVPDSNCVIFDHPC